MVPNMSEEFGPDFITVTDEDGNEFELEHLDTLEYNGQTYMAFFPAVEGKEDGSVEDVDLDEEYGLVILKVIEADGEEQLSTLDRGGAGAGVSAVYGVPLRGGGRLGRIIFSCSVRDGFYLNPHL